jgi:hypothetical protein
MSVKIIITNGVRKIKRPAYTSVFFDNTKRRQYLAVDYCNNEEANRLLPISKRVAEVLIARGMSYGS